MKGLLRVRRSCALCASTALSKVMSLPDSPLANEFVSEKSTEPQEKFPLTLQLCHECGHLQLAEVIDPKRLFSNYVYVSGTSPVFVKHFEDYARDVAEQLSLPRDGLIIDIGSNDGTLLKAFNDLGYTELVGYEPAQQISEECQEKHPFIDVIPCFFSRNQALHAKQVYGGASLVTANNVFAHAEDLREIALAVSDVLAPDGVFAFEVSYLSDVVERELFDTIYHEHLSYHTVKPLVQFLKDAGLTLYHAHRVDTHGGSIRCFAARARKTKTVELKKLIREEVDRRLFDAETFQAFQTRISDKGAWLRRRVSEWKTTGLKVCGYGAPAKLTTLMHAFQLNGADFEYIIDDSPWKQGLYTPGLHIPVVSSSKLAESLPQVIVVFAWNFFDNIIKKNQHIEGDFLWVNPVTLKSQRTGS